MSTMTEREMLEMAAVAIGLENLYWGDVSTENLLDHLVISTHEDGRVTTHKWNPIKDDGDALRLAETLGMTLCMDGTGTVSAHTRDEDGIQDVFITQEIGKSERISATRLAITRAAASIGRSKHE